MRRPKRDYLGRPAVHDLDVEHASVKESRRFTNRCHIYSDLLIYGRLLSFAGDSPGTRSPISEQGSRQARCGSGSSLSQGCTRGLAGPGSRGELWSCHRPSDRRHQRNISASAEMIFGRSFGGAPWSATQTITILLIAAIPSATATAQTSAECHRLSHINLIADIQPHLSRGAPAHRRMRKCFGHPAGSAAVIQCQLYRAHRHLREGRQNALIAPNSYGKGTV
jgi:hypothetical protein